MLRRARERASRPSGNAYVAGWTGGSFPGHTSAGSADPFVRKYDPSGNELWTRQFGTAAFDAAAGVALDAGGNAYLTGSTDGTFPGQASAGGADAFVRKYDTGGNPLWTRQFGTAASDQASDAAVDAAGNAYVAGSTGGTFPGQTSAGGVDAFAAKIVPGQMFTVNTTDDLDDGLCDALHCSLREAINAANTNPGKDTIAFNIPGPAFHTIKPGSELPTISDPVTIDGTTEPHYSGRPVVELDGSNAGSGPNFSNGLTISAGNTTIRALTINRFFGAGIFLLGGSGNMIEGNYIGTDVTGTVDRGNAVEGVLVFGSSGNRIGGTAGSISHPFGMCTGSCNLISGNDKDGIGIVGASVGNQIQGNMIGTWVVGEGDLGNSQDGVFIGGSGSAATGNIIGGTTLAALNVISANDRNGVRINGAGSTGNVVQGNFIGTRGSGSGDLGNAQSGVVIDGGSAGNTIGGTASGAGNLISGNDLDGVSLSAAGSGNSILGNKIGTDRGFGGAAFADIGNSFHGIRVVATSGVMIGGTPANAPNTIAFNDDDGIAVVSGTGNSIRRNAIFSNGGLGIDLGTNGVTANDPGDGDTGANDLQNFTVLTSAITAAGVTTVQGTLNSTANTTFTLEFFANGVCDASGHGEGESFKGSTMVTTNGSGMASFAFVLSTAAPAGQFLTATATDPGNNTSELSKCREVSTAAGAVTDLIGDVQDLKLQQGIENSLIVKLQAALGALAAGDTTTACNNLGAFINEVQAQSGKKIPAQDAADLVKKAEDLKKALGCP